MSAYKQKNEKLLSYALKASFFGDGFIFLIIIFQFLTGTALAVHAHLLNQPWVKVAYIAFSLLSILWCVQFCLKRRAHFSIRWFSVISIVMILIFVAIIHDAVRHQTYFWPFGGG